MAPHPAWVTGPRHGVPWATITHVLPRRLHSSHTLCPGICGFRPTSSAVSSSRSWPLSMGQPRSSKSTGTWLAMGVEVAVRNGVVTLSGQPELAAEEDLIPVAVRLAWDIDGVVDVVNKVSAVPASAAMS